MNDYILAPNGELKHYGVKGMKWGVRRVDKRADKLRAKVAKYDNAKWGSKEMAKRYKYDKKLDDYLRKNNAYTEFGVLSDSEKKEARARIKPSKYASSKTKYHLMSPEKQREVDRHYDGAIFMQNYLIKYAKNSSDRRTALANSWVLHSEYERITHEEPRD